MSVEWSKEIRYGGGGSYEWPGYDGVYVIAKKSNNNLFARYVGQGNIKERMSAHENWKTEENDCLKEIMKNRDEFTKVFHAEIKDDQDRNNAEYTLYAYYGGKDNLCNEIDPPLGETIYTLNFPFDKINVNY